MDLIRTTLELIRDKLNEFFRRADGSNKEWVALTNIVGHDGSTNNEAKDKVVMFLANIKHETTISTYRSTVPIADNKYAQVSPPLYIDLYLLFMANFYDQNYTEGLGMISRTISFFQQNPYFDHQNLPSLDPVIDKLTFEMTSLDLTELNYLMGLAGTKYLPSVFFKMRMLPFCSDAMQAEQPAVQGLEPAGGVSDDDVNG